MQNRVTVAKQLEDDVLASAKCKRKMKKPFEPGWSKKPYKWNDPDLQKWLDAGGNYGCLGGHGDLVILDCDDLPRLQELGVTTELPETFTVQTPGRKGWHMYFICPGLGKKMALYDPEKKEKDKNGREIYAHVADLASHGMQCVGPTSIRHFPGDEEEYRSYQVINDIPITMITLEQLQEAIKILRTSQKVEKIQPKEIEDKPAILHEPGAKELWVGNILLPDRIIHEDIDGTGEIQGSHPIHGSEGGKNFSINIKKNTWYCHRDKVGGGPLELLALREGVLPCDAFTKGWRMEHPDEWAQTLELARKYGFKVPRAPSGDNQTELARDSLRYAIDVMETLEDIVCLQNDDLLIFNGKVYEYPTNAKDYGEKAIRVMAKSLMGRNGLDRLRTEVVKYFRDTPRLEIEDFDMQKGQVVAENGILNMETGELRPHTPEFLATVCLPMSWNPNADTSVIDTWMEWFMPDEKTRHYIWKFLGATLAGVTGLQLFHIFYGEMGNNGKDTLLSLMNEILGRTAWTTNPGTFLKDKYGKDKTFSLAFIRGVKLLMATETERGAYLSEAVIKALSGSRMNARAPYGKYEINFEHKSSSVLVTNYLPKIAGGVKRPMKRRLRIIKCSSSLPEGSSIADYHLELIKEGGEGFLRRLVEGYQAFLEEGLDPSPMMIKDLAEYIKEEDPLQGFVESCLLPDKNGSLSSSDAFLAWKAYTLTCGLGESDDSVRLRRWFGQHLSSQIREMGWTVSKKQGCDVDRGRTIYEGVSLNPDFLDVIAATIAEDDLPGLRTLNAQLNLLPTTA